MHVNVLSVGTCIQLLLTRAVSTTHPSIYYSPPGSRAMSSIAVQGGMLTARRHCSKLCAYRSAMWPADNAHEQRVQQHTCCDHCTSCLLSFSFQQARTTQRAKGTTTQQVVSNHTCRTPAHTCAGTVPHDLDRTPTDSDHTLSLNFLPEQWVFQEKPHDLDSTLADSNHTLTLLVTDSEAQRCVAGPYRDRVLNVNIKDIDRHTRRRAALLPKPAHSRRWQPHKSCAPTPRHLWPRAQHLLCALARDTLHWRGVCARSRCTEGLRPPWPSH